MRILSVRMTNFRSFEDEQVFIFPEKPGLYFMQGINEVEPRLEANGAGKSTIWDAVTWCISGKTPRGLKAGDVCNWKAGKGTKVDIDYILDEGDTCVWTVTRTWGPNSWTLSHVADFITDEEVIDLTKDKSNPVLEALRLEFTPFLNCILMAQGQPMFLDQKHDAQAALFSDVMGLDRWIDYSSKASKKASAQDSITRLLERKVAELSGTLVAMGRNDLTVSAEQWEIQQGAKLNELEAKYKAAIERLRPIKDSMPDLELEEKERRLVWATLRDPIDDLQDRLNTMKMELHDYDLMLGIATSEGNTLKRALDKLEASNSCSACGQRLNPAEHREHVQKARREWASNVKERSRLESEITGLDRSMAAQQAALDKAWSQVETAKSRHEQTTENITHIRRDVQMIERELDRMEEQAEALTVEVNPFAAMQKQAIAEGQRLRAELDEVQEKLDNSQHRYSLLSFWVKGFKELRLQLIAEALNELEIEVNSCVAALGLLGWELKFQVDRETKGGSIQRGFSVLVRSPHNRLAVPWEAWSGGEAQRLRLACTMGLADLIRSRSGATLNLEVWDEPTRDLSGQGVDDLLASLAARARHEGRIIWLVDHRTHNFGGFAGGVTIVKTKEGSCLRNP